MGKKAREIWEFHQSLAQRLIPAGDTNPALCACPPQEFAGHPSKLPVHQVSNPTAAGVTPCLGYFQRYYWIQID